MLDAMAAITDALGSELGLTLMVLLSLLYTVYENRVGTVAKTQRRLQAIAVAVYRVAQVTDDVDAEAVRREVNQNWGEDMVYPGDFDVGDPSAPSADDRRGD